MEQECIEILVEGRTQSFDPGMRLLSSSGTGWEGFLLEAHRISQSGRLTRISQRHNLVVLCTAGWATVEVCIGGVEHRLTVTAGNLCLLGGGYELGSLAWSGTHEIVIVRVCPKYSG